MIVAVEIATRRVRDVFAAYAFPSVCEVDLQRKLLAVLARAGIACDHEVIADRGRYDIVVKRGAA